MSRTNRIYRIYIHRERELAHIIMEDGKFKICKVDSDCQGRHPGELMFQFKSESCLP